MTLWSSIQTGFSKIHPHLKETVFTTDMTLVLSRFTNFSSWCSISFAKGHSWNSLIIVKRPFSLQKAYVPLDQQIDSICHNVVYYPYHI